MQTIIDYITANLATITTIQQGLFAALAALFQLLGMPKASKLFGTFTTIDLGRVLRYFTLKHDIINGALLVSCVLALAGCGGSLHTQIEKALVFEQQVHTYHQQLMSVADAAIVMLPPEKQAQARATLVDANTKLTLALDAKDATLQAALEASSTNFDLNRLIADIVSAVSAVVAVVNSFGADRAQTEYVGRALVAAQVRATR